ncbi:hypothetical protein DB41_DH00180 [Neochlamydia sp. TUME1]|nr:hypothetical protein [Neochlamydia sp. TUME1]KIC77070.1 hypothetical protein DB41_DH00180 [Neochlamydia sp. TUME1]
MLPFQQALDNIEQSNQVKFLVHYISQFYHVTKQDAAAYFERL